MIELMNDQDTIEELYNKLASSIDIKDAGAILKIIEDLAPLNTNILEDKKNAYTDLIPMLQNGIFPSSKSSGQYKALDPFVSYPIRMEQWRLEVAKLSSIADSDIPNSPRDNRPSCLRKLLFHWNLEANKDKSYLEHSTDGYNKGELLKLIKKYGGKVIEEIKAKKSNALCLSRQSTLKKENQGKHFRAIKSLGDRAKSYGYTPHVLYLADISGSFVHHVVKYILDNTDYLAIFVEDISRLSRNLLEGVDLLKTAFEEDLKVYEGSTLITEGSGFIQAVLKLIFAEYELLSKQGKISQYMREVANYFIVLLKDGRNKAREFKLSMHYKAIKLISIVQYAGKEPFYEKAYTKALENDLIESAELFAKLLEELEKKKNNR